MPAASTPVGDMPAEQRAIIDRLAALQADIDAANEARDAAYRERVELYIRGLDLGITAKSLGQATGSTGVAVMKAVRKITDG